MAVKGGVGCGRSRIGQEELQTVACIWTSLYQLNREFWNKDQRNPVLGRPGQTLVIPACTVLAGGYPGRTWPQLKHVTDPEGTAARSCQSTALLEAGEQTFLKGDLCGIQPQLPHSPKPFPNLYSMPTPTTEQWLEHGWTWRLSY